LLFICVLKFPIECAFGKNQTSASAYVYSVSSYFCVWLAQKIEVTQFLSLIALTPPFEGIRGISFFPYPELTLIMAIFFHKG